MTMLKVNRWIGAGTSVLLALAACSGQKSDSSSDQWSGPTVMASVTVEDASPTDQAVKVVRSQHYEIYSTIQDRPEMLNRLAQLMEGGFAMYRTVAPMSSRQFSTLRFESFPMYRVVRPMAATPKPASVGRA